MSPERARALLEGLSTEARAMMPVDTLRSLEEAAALAKDEPPTAANPPVVRSRLGFTGLGRRGTTTASLPPVKGPEPPNRENHATLRPEPPKRRTTAPARAVPLPPPAEEEDSIEPISTAALRPLDTNEMNAYRPEKYTSFNDLEPVPAPVEPLTFTDIEPLTFTDIEPLTEGLDSDPPAPPSSGGPLTAALKRGGGPFGARETPYRLILLPEEDYKSKAHWLRHRVADTTGADLYTAAQMLNKEVPSFLYATEDADDAHERVKHLQDGGLTVLLLQRDRQADIEPIYVTEASGSRPGPVTFTTAEGAMIEVKRGGFAWACLGEIEPDGQRTSRVRDRGFRGRDVPDRPTFDAGAGPYLLLDLFLTRATQPIRLRSDRFDFTCLGRDRELAATLNLRKMLAWLALDPSRPVPLDELFKRVPHLRVTRSDGDEGVVPQRETEFTEYGLIRNAQQRGATTA